MELSRGLFEVRFVVYGRGVTRRYVCEWVEVRSWEKLSWGRSGKKEREDSRPALQTEKKEPMRWADLREVKQRKWNREG